MIIGHTKKYIANKIILESSNKVVHEWSVRNEKLMTSCVILCSDLSVSEYYEILEDISSS